MSEEADVAQDEQQGSWRDSLPGVVEYDSAALPMLFEGDVVVLGGSLAGVAAAIELAGSGRRVAVVEPRTYLGSELTASGRPWFEAAGAHGPGALPEPLRSFIEPLAERAEEVLKGSGELPFAMDSLKLHLEDALLGAGVKLLYASLPLAVESRAHGIDGVVVGNKSGRQFLACEVVIDATGSDAAYAAAGGGSAPPLIRVLEFDGLATPLVGSLRVPAHLGTTAGEVRVHRGHRSARHVLVECRFDHRSPLRDGPGATDPMRAAAAELRMREASMQVAIHLMANEPAFAGSYLAGSSLETTGLPAALPLSQFDGGPAGTRVWSVGRHAGGPTVGALDPVASCLAGRELGRRLAADWQAAMRGPAGESESDGGRSESAGGGRQPGERGTEGHGAGGPLLSDRGRDAAGSEGRAAGRGVLGGRGIEERETEWRRLRVREPEGGWRRAGHTLREVAGRHIPILRHSQALVVGGGTSGATAATVAAREGLSTLLVEMNPGLGGTGTYGGVNDYWFGRKVGFSGRLNDAVNEYHRCLRHEFPESDVPRWNIDAKAHVLAQAALGAGVEILLNSFVIGTLVADEEGRDDEPHPLAVADPQDRAKGRTKVVGVVVATRSGPLALLADVIIDATGDGDVAAFAGAEHVYGSAREHVTMWYSLAQFGIPGHTRNNFTSTVDVSNIEDYTRAILAGRRRRRTDKDLHDHGIYVAPRETRHILGEVVLTLTDQLLGRAWPDTVNIAFSNNDIKGHTTSDWVRLGLISPNLEVEVPYRAIVPRDLDNVLVVGKAVSATHDALPAIRMQADLENLGGVAALAAAQALAAGCTVRDLDVAALQERLGREGVLPEGLAVRKLAEWRPDEEDLEALIRELPSDEPLYAYSDMPIGAVYRERIPLVDIVCAGPHAVPLLEEALASAGGERRLRLAQALAMVQSPAAAPVLVEAIERELASGELPPRAKGIRHAVAPPDQGAMPEVVYLIHALGMTADERALAVWQRLADMLRDVTAADVRDAKEDIFDYVDSICVGAERMGSREALPILEQLHGYEPFRDQVCHEPFQADYFSERQAYLELIIGRAMARCGGEEGLRILVDYLADTRAMLAEHAHAELVAITGRDEGEVGSWREWLRERKGPLEPRPWLMPTDAVASWGESILVEPPSTSAHSADVVATGARGGKTPENRDKGSR